MARLAVFFDGTWNTPAEKTNVHRLSKLLDDLDPRQQDGKYIQGVGTETGGLGLLAAAKKLIAGAFGRGLSQNIQEGYRWLVDRYHLGDEIFLFGFSRGAYSARSLAGLIRNAGLLHPEHVARVGDAYDLYRDRHPPDSEEALRFRESFSREVEIAFIGVWDTVGSLGIPIQGLRIPGLRDSYAFHSTGLSNQVRAAYHALALNEFRDAYSPTFWTQSGAARPAELPVEQRWFAGAHANVGGGYRGDQLCNLPCRWIQQMAQRHGLQFMKDWPVGPTDYRFDVRDSYAEFASEHPGLLRRVPRTLGGAATLNETVDPSVLERIAASGSEADASFQLDAGSRQKLVLLPAGKDWDRAEP